MHSLALLCIGSGAAILLFVAGQALQLFINIKGAEMASPIYFELSSVVSNLVQIAMNQADALAKPHPDSQELVDEIAAERALVDKIKAAMAALAPAAVAPDPAPIAPAPNAVDEALAAAAAKAHNP